MNEEPKVKHEKKLLLQYQFFLARLKWGYSSAYDLKLSFSRPLDSKSFDAFLSHRQPYRARIEERSIVLISRVEMIIELKLINAIS